MFFHFIFRYDARLLLDALPLHLRSTTNATRSVPDSPGGWSDIPSDSEDTFFFSPQEVEDFHREKKRRLLDTNREERLRARRIEDGESSEVEEDEEIWGGSDEEPDDSQRELMRRTAQHILSSPKPAQLEMRILANHGGDKKFAFLRGRWSRVWRILKGKARREKEEHDKERDKGREDKVGNGLGVLVGYEDSEDEGDDDDARNVGTSYDREAESGQSEKTEPANQKPLNDDITKMARRARAKEWAEKRRAL